MQVIITDYASRERDIRRVRDAVFIQEQAVAREEEVDHRDALCTHVLVYDDAAPIATGRIDLEKAGKVGRVAVLPAFRRMGIGTQVMRALEQVASNEQIERIWFHAQLQAVGFYQQLGYRACSDEFLEAGIPHVGMEKCLVGQRRVERS